MSPLNTPPWRKSSRSTDQANCVEVGYWRKSTHSADDANCLELTFPGQMAGIRDSKNPDAPHLTLNLPAYQAFLTFTTR